MPCKICREIERSLDSARDPGPPSLVLGLTEAGRRNRERQKAEKILELEGKLQKHKKNCPEQRALPSDQVA